MFPLKDNIPTRRFPVVTVALIAANVLMYLFFQEAVNSGFFNGPDEQNAVDYGAIPCELTRECSAKGPATPITALTSMFMHGGLLHLGGNMLFLWIFGNNVEDSMGRIRFILFYLAGGLVAIAAQTAINTDADVPTIGASGAVAAVLGGYLLLYPRARVVTVVFIVIFFTFIELPAFLVLGAWFVLQLFSASVDVNDGGGGVAYFAHIGGFVFGLLLIKLLANRVQDDYVRRDRLPVY